MLAEKGSENNCVRFWCVIINRVESMKCTAEVFSFDNSGVSNGIKKSCRKLKLVGA